MRLVRLDLERYGPFTARSLAFREDARLHVVLGPNEAGKSTALAAVTDLLFGIEPRTRYAFFHEMPSLRIAAEIVSGDGRRLAFRRRKGRGSTLADLADAPLPDEALAPFLDGLTRDVFCRAFGLDSEQLRRGGAEMLDSKGELGASLFAAASGLRGYTALQAQLDAEAQGVFTIRRARDRSFYQALDRYEEARKAIRATELRQGAWKELNDEIAAAEARLDTVKEARRRIASERARLERLKRIAPLVASVDEAAAQAEADAALVEAAEPAVTRLDQALAAYRAAEADAARLEGDRAATAAGFAAMAEPSAVLERAEAIEEGHSGIKQFDMDRDHLPGFRSELARLARELDERAVRVGLADGRMLALKRPTDAQCARIETLIRDAQALSAETVRIERERDAARAEHEGLSREEAESGPPVDPSDLRQALKAFDWLRAAIGERSSLDGTVQRAEGVLRGKAARLSPPVHDVPALARLSLPSPSAVARVREVFDASLRDRAVARQRKTTAEAAVAKTVERLRRRAAGGPIASRADLDAVRLARDGAFATLREALAGGTPAAPAAVAGYERAVHDADRLADDLAADAARVAEQAADREQLGLAQAEAEAAKTALETLDAHHAERLAAWADLWQSTGFAPAPPDEMARWLSAVETLIEEQSDLDQHRIGLAMRSERIAAVVAPLAELGRHAGLDGLNALDAALLLARVEERIDALARRWEATRATTLNIRNAAAAIARHEAALAEAGDRRTALEAAWHAAVPALGLAPEARVEEATSALAAWREVPTLMRDRDEAGRRAASIEDGIETYRARIARLVEGSPDLDPAEPSAAIRTLHKRLRIAQADDTRRIEARKRLDEAERRVGSATRVRDEAETTLGRALCEIDPGLAGCGIAEIEALLGRLATRRGLRMELSARRAELLRASDGLAEAALRADLVATSPDAIEARLAQLLADQDDNEQQGRIAFAAQEDGTRRRAALEAGTGAELAHAEKKAAEAELGAAARQWAVLKLASLMLHGAIARHRAGRQDPLLDRAGALFGGLTGGAFVGLAQGYNDKDEPCILGRRGSGRTVEVEGMSEGTRDQLYLALRLAYLQDFSTRAEAAPFIGDDLFSTFDDARTGHGLEALAAIGESIQPILFTHHRHVADLAAARLGERADIVAL